LTIKDKLTPMWILFGICSVILVLAFHALGEVADQETRIDELEERLSKLERDAVKITFDKKNEK
jgi:hypothetical protein